MPEGPEVTIVAKAVGKYLKNETLLEINILPNSKYIKKSPDNYNEVIKQLPLKLLSVENKGKVIYFTFEKNIYMINHLIMSGIWSKEKDKYSSIELVFKDKKAYFSDARKFGFVEFLLSKKELNEKLDNLGPDFLNDKDFDFKLFNRLINKKKNSNITTVLMDQKIMSGIGNYIKSEMLYEAKINPHRKVSSLSLEEREKLFKAGKRVIKDSYKSGGLSRVNYLHFDGSKGSFQDKLKVYGLKETKEGYKIKSEKTKDGRTTHWVPEIQI